jgi:putative ABC transport system permease protein
MLSDLRYAVRSLGRAYGFTLVVVLTLALGIGAAAAIFSVADWILFRWDPYPEKSRLFVLGMKSKEGPSNPYTFGYRFQAYQKLTEVFSEFSATKRDSSVNVLVKDEPVPSAVQCVSADCFHTLGFSPVLGRGFLPEEFKTGADNVVVISHDFWQSHFGSTPDALGREIRIGDQLCKVVGVLSADAKVPVFAAGNIFRPLILNSDLSKPQDPRLMVIGRLKPGVTRQHAEAAMGGIKVDLAPKAAANIAELAPTLMKLDELKRFFHPEIYWVLVGAVGFLYAIACLNATNLMLVRVLGKRRELSIRVAIGGGRWHIVRLMAIESLGLSLVAGAAGIMVAHWFFPVLLRLASTGSGSGNSGSLSWRMLGVMAGLTVCTSVLVVAAPVVRILKANLNDGLKDGGMALGESRRLGRARSMLVVLQAAFAVILLVGAGLMVRTLEKLRHVDLGFDPTGEVKVQLTIPDGHRTEKEDRLLLFQQLQEKLATIPGVRSVAFGSDALFPGYSSASMTMRLPDGGEASIERDMVSPEFLQTAGLTLVRGRWLPAKRNDGTEVVINETLAKKRFGKEDPIGQMISIVEDGPWQVVGVVRDIRQSVRSAPGLHVYCSDWWWTPNLNTVVLRLDHDPDMAFVSTVRKAVFDFDPRLVIWNLEPVNVWIQRTMYMEELTLSVLKVLSGIALVLAVVGLFSILAYTVDRRMSEFGVRLALGATPRDLAQLVFKRGIMLSAIGVAAGIAGALGLTRFLQSLLFETAPFDPLVYLAVAGVLLAAAAASCWIPARRAARVDVARLLRAE